MFRAWSRPTTPGSGRCGAVLWRKNSFGSASERGRRFVERMLTAVTTLRLRGKTVVSYLQRAIKAYALGQPAPMLVGQNAQRLPEFFLAHTAPAMSRHYNERDNAEFLKVGEVYAHVRKGLTFLDKKDSSFKGNQEPLTQAELDSRKANTFKQQAKRKRETKAKAAK